MDVDFDCRVLMRGEAAVAAALAAGATVEPPRPVGDGWWTAVVALPPGTEPPLGAGPALLAQWGPAPAVLLALRDADDGPVAWHAVGFSEYGGPPDGAPAPAETAAALAAWSSRAPKPLTPRRAGTLLRRIDGEPGRAAVDALFRALGFDVRRREPWELLGGAVQPFGHSGTGAYVGETEVDWDTLRWQLAQGEDFVGLWDLDRPGEPVERWPRDAHGHRLASARLSELVEWPILRQTVLTGDLTWAPARYVDWMDSRAHLVHVRPDGGASVFYCGDRPCTMIVFKPGQYLRWTLQVDPVTGVTTPGTRIVNTGPDAVWPSILETTSYSRLAEFRPLDVTRPVPLLDAVAAVRALAGGG